MFAAFGASRFDSGQGLLSWNMHLCIIILFIANVAVTPFRLMTIFSALSLLFYLGFLVFGSKLDFIDALVHGAALFCIGLILAPFLSMARYRTVTDNVRMRHRITLQNEELRGLNAGKDRFFSIIAHDLRGPIGSTIRLMENILDEENPDCKSDLHLILESMNRIYSLLETLLLWARSQKGELSLVPVRLKVAEVITRAFNDVTQAVAEKKIVIDIKADQSAHVFADENMLNTILRNLLSNAVKYTRAGGWVTVSSERHDGRLIMQVRDTGIGIDRERLEHLFSLDAKQGAASTKGERGSGLGLVLCREFARNNQGRLWAESVPGEGSSFFLELPEG